jgi:hypothetical protein
MTFMYIAEMTKSCPSVSTGVESKQNPCDSPGREKDLVLWLLKGCQKS